LNITPLSDVQGCYVIDIDRYTDDRGYFQELYSKDKYEHFSNTWDQASCSRSCKNVIRGIHCSPYPKLCCCISGRMYDVAIDLREDSPTYLQWTGQWLTSENCRQFYVPANCGHAFYAAEDDTVILYMQGGVFNEDQDKVLNPLDPTINIAWPDADYVISKKDSNASFITETKID